MNYEAQLEAKAIGSTYRNPFNKGWKKNLIRVFGQNLLSSILYPNNTLPPEPDYPFELSVLDSTLNV